MNKPFRYWFFSKTIKKHGDLNKTLPLHPYEQYGYYLLISAYTPAVLIMNFLMPNLIDHYGREVGVLANQLPCHSDPTQVCYINLLTFAISTPEYAQFALACSSLLQGLILVPLSTLADVEYYRYFLLMIFTILGSLSFILTIINCSSLVCITVLAILGSFSCSGMAATTLSFIPIYAQLHPKVLNSSPEEKDKISEQVTLELTTKGGILSLVSTTLLCSIGSLINNLLEQTNLGLRISIMLGGIWWLILGISGWLLIIKRQGKTIENNQSKLKYSLICLKETVKICYNSFPLLQILFAFFLLSEGSNTSGTITFILAIGELNMSYGLLSIITFLLPLSCALGTGLFGIVQSKLQFNVQKGLVSMALLTSIIIAANFIGLYNPYIGIKSHTEVILAYVISSSFFGPVLVIFRSLLADLVPKHFECQVFTLITLTTSGSSWIGVLLVLIINKYTGTPRYGGYMAFTLVLLGAYNLYRANLSKGRQLKYQTISSK